MLPPVQSMGSGMVTDQECLDYARDCVRLADFANDRELRNYLLQLAREWMATAMHEENVPERKSSKLQ
jgi:hypothetical protein